MEILQADDTLREEILNDANIKADRIIKKAEREAEEIIKNSDEQIKLVEKEYSDSFLGNAEESIKLILASIEIEVKKANLKIIEDNIENIFNDFKTLILEEKFISYKEFLLKLINIAASKISSSSFIVEINKNLLKKITKESLLKLDKVKIDQVIENNDIPEIVLYSKDRKTASYISLENFLEELKILERTNIYKILLKG